jgi:hypothetical protein
MFDFVSSSYQPYAPLRSMQHAGFRNGSFNGLVENGIFRKRGGVTADALTIPVTNNGAFADLWNGQSPADMSITYMDFISATLEGPVAVVLTTSECYVITLAPTTVVNVTPRYSLGTVSITTGTAALAGTGTFWVDEGIKAGQLVNLPNGSADWYSISVVNSNTSITLKSNLSTGTLVAQPYTIRRTGRNSSAPLAGAASNLFARIFNGDLYYTFVEGTSNFCVVRVLDVLNAASSTPTIIGCNVYDNLSGCDVWSAAGGEVVSEFKGLELLSDGRVVLATTESIATGNAMARIRYSSHLDQMVWNEPPGGTNDVVLLPGKMNAMKEFGGYLACHFDRGIVVAIPNGQDDPPLNYQRVQTTTIGCESARPLANTPIGQIYLGTDGNVWTFDGSGQTQLSDATRNTWSATAAYSSWHACYEAQQSTFWLFQVGATNTGIYTINTETGIVGYHKVGTIITAACDPGAPTGDIRLILGLPSFDPAVVSGTSGATSTMIYDLDFSDTADVVPAFTGYAATSALTLITDWMDMDMPGIDKTISHILLYYISGGSYTFRTIYLRDGLNTATNSINLTTTATEEKVAKLWFPPATSEKWRFEFGTATTADTAWDVRPQRAIIFYRVSGPMEAVAR